jgi:hypothetical protein
MIRGILVGCFLGEPERAQTPSFFCLGLSGASAGLQFVIDFLCCLELLFGTLSVWLAGL